MDRVQWKLQTTEATDDGQRRWKLQTNGKRRWKLQTMGRGDGSHRRWAEAMEATDDGQKRWKLQTTEATDD